MKLRAPYLLLAHQLQESGISTDDFRDLMAALKPKEAGARNSKSDQAIIQTIHDHAMALGACCAEPDADDMAEAALTERDIPQSERDKMPDSDFAGKGDSYPIKKPEDVGAALQSIGRAGPENYSHDKLKANILRIAKRKGFPIPESDQKAKESASDTGSGEIRLVESAPVWCEELDLREAAAAGVRTKYPIRIIDPGEGSTAYYPKEVLQREAAKFKPGTLMYWNHPTKAEEKERPEGNLDHLAAITTSQGVWREDGPKGPGIYAEAKVMADYAEKVNERAPHIGLSIRAGGNREAGRAINGKPVLKEFTYIESVDYVTKAGRGGLALAEAARDAGLLLDETQPTEVSMTEAEAKALIEAAVSPFRTRALRGDAREEAARLLKDIDLPEAAKTRITERALTNVPTTESGDLDSTKLRESIVQESRAEAEYLASIVGPGKVRGMGIAPPPAPKPEDIAAREAAAKREYEEDVALFESMGMPHDAAVHAAKGRAA